MVPLIFRSLAAVVGGLLVLTAWASAIGTLIVPRPIGSWLTRWVDKIVNGSFRLASASSSSTARRRSRRRAASGPSVPTSS